MATCTEEKIGVIVLSMTTAEARGLLVLANRGSDLLQDAKEARATLGLPREIQAALRPLNALRAMVPAKATSKGHYAAGDPS